MTRNITAELKGHFIRLYQMAITDGEFSPSELKMLYQFAEERGISTDDLDRLFLGNTGSIVIPQSIETKLEYLFDLCKLIWADEVVSEDERVTLHKFCRKFGFEEENIEQLAEFLLKAAKENKPIRELLAELQ
jgi:uncharacterized tellurite resistance protein B-like protein